MSVILYNDQTFVDIAFNMKLFKTRYTRLGSAFRHLFDHNNPISDQIEVFVQDLSELNTTAWNIRYRENVLIRKVDFVEGRIYPNIELLREMQSVRYNCVESEDHIMLDLLSRVIGVIAECICDDLEG